MVFFQYFSGLKHSDGGLLPHPRVLRIGRLFCLRLDHEVVPLDAMVQEPGHALVDPFAVAVVESVQVRMPGRHCGHADELIFIREYGTARPSLEKIVRVKLNRRRVIPKS